MPLYDLECTECGHQFTEQYKLAEVDDAKCPECGQPVRKLITCVPPRHVSWSKWRVGHGS